MESPYNKDLYNVNVLVLTEKSPQSDQYYQINLTKEQYIKLLDFLQETVGVTTNCPDGTMDIEIPVIDDELVHLPNKNAHT